MTPAEELFETWIAHLRSGGGFKSLGTVNAYRKSLAAFIRETGTRDFAEVGVRQIDEYVSSMSLGKLAVGTIRSRLFCLRSFWKFAVSRDYLTKDPMALVAIPGDDRTRREIIVLDKKEREALFAAALAQRPEQGKKERAEFFARRLEIAAGLPERDHALLLVAFAAALRISEVAALEWRDVLPADRRDGAAAITIRRSKRSSLPSKPAYIGKVASVALQRWRAISGGRGSVFGLSISGISNVFDRVARAAGVSRKYGRRVTFHCLRATRATAASRAGLDDRAVADLLRHSNTASVAAYVRAADETTRRFDQVASLEHPELLADRKRRRKAVNHAPLEKGY